MDVAHHDYRLMATSPFHRAGLDGRDIGVDWDALRGAIKTPF